MHLSSKTAAAGKNFPKYNLLRVTKPYKRLKLAKGKLITDTVTFPQAGVGKQVRYICTP